MKKMIIAFILNISFSIIELIGGVFTNSVAIISDAVHDFGDSLSIGISLVLEKKAKKKPDENYTYGYARYSVLGALFTTTILAVGSVLVIIGGIKRLFNPQQINYDGMILFAILGVVINFLASYFTKDGESLNQRSVNLHMLEDVLGWIVVLIGSILMKFTNITVIDSLMSIGVAIFIIIHAIKNLKEILDLFLVKTPNDVAVEEIKKYLQQINGIINVHHIHLWSIDGKNNYATMHIKTNTQDTFKIKQDVRNRLKEKKITHVTIELEGPNEDCGKIQCN